MRAGRKGTLSLGCGPLCQQQFDHHQRFSTRSVSQHSLPQTTAARVCTHLYNMHSQSNNIAQLFGDHGQAIDTAMLSMLPLKVTH